jgi:O-antigen/teichoic acid export membrane protein
VVAQAAASLIEKFLLLRASFKLMPTLKPSFRLEWPLVNRQMRFGSWVLLANLGNAVYEAMDPILLNRFSFPASVGAFHLGSLPAKHLKGLALQMTAPLQPALVGFYEHGQSKELQTIFFGIGRYTLWLQGLLICPAIVYGAKLFELYLGNRYAVYHEAPYAMTLTLLAWIPYYSLYGLRWLAYAHERIKWFNLITLGSQVANLALTWFFLARLGWGAIGSGLASLIALWLFFCVGFLPLSIHSFNISPVQYLKDTVLRGLLPWIACTAVLLLLRPIVVSWRGLLLASMAGAAVYGVCLLLCLHGSDRANLNRALKAVARQFQKTPEL